MARIAGVDLPRNKHMDRALTYIYGIGLTSARQILDKADLPYQMNSDDLSGDDVTRIRKIIESDHVVEGDRRREISMDIKRLMDLGAIEAEGIEEDYRAVGREQKPMHALVKVLSVALQFGKIAADDDQAALTREFTELLWQKPVKRQENLNAVRKNISEGIIFIYSTFNNTIITVTDRQGNAFAWSTAGVIGFKGSRKSTPFAAQNALNDAIGKAKEHGLRKVEVRVKGPGPGREAALRALTTLELDVTRIVDVTPLPHNGCKPPKRRRV